MKTFVELTKRAFQKQINYRAATLAGLATNFFWGLLRVALIKALYEYQVEVEGFSLQDAITYTGITQATIGYLAAFGWYDLMRVIYSGEIAGDLLKPVSLYTFWMAQDLGRALAQFLTRGVTIMLAYAVFVGIAVPQTFGQWLLLACTLVLAWWVSFSMRFLVNLVAFWATNAVGILRFFFFGSLFFTGFLMPLRFFPDWVNTIAYLTPFPHMINTTVEIYLGVITGWEAVLALVWQVLWGIGLLIVGQIVLRFGIKKLVIMGG